MGHISLGFRSDIFFALFGLFFGLIVTHRSAGPVYAFRRFLGELKNKPDATLKLREQDYHKQLEDMAKDVKALIGDEK